MWSKRHDACVVCGGTHHKHVGHGKCQLCYQREYMPSYNARNSEAVSKHKRKWYEQNIVGTGKQKLAREIRNFDGNRDATLARDGHKCTQCGSVKGLTVHHKDRNGRGTSTPNNANENLITLCRKCHINEHRAELLAGRSVMTHCKRGHAFSEHGRHNGRQWVCRECMKLRAREYKRKKREGLVS